MDDETCEDCGEETEFCEECDTEFCPDCQECPGCDPMTPRGDCFEAAGRYLMTHGLTNPDLVLVHGEVVGRGKIQGVHFGHAWIEDPTRDLVYEVANNANLTLPRFLYYAMGNIPMTGGNMFRYTLDELNQKLLEHEHWGPWDLETEH